MIKTLLFIGFALLFLHSQTSAQIDGSPTLKMLNGKLVPVTKSVSKLSSSLMGLYDNYSASGVTSNARVGNTSAGAGANKFMQVRGDKVLVDVTLKDDDNTSLLKLESMGLKVNAVFGRVVSGTIAISALPLFQSSTMIRFVRPSYRSKRNFKTVNNLGVSNVKFATPVPVISQGDTALRAYLARKKYKVNGKGVKIGILSDSYNNLGTADIGVKNGELPGPGNPFNHKKPVQVLLDLEDSSGTDEGRGMAEIIHDLAPGAEIAFYTAYDGEASFAQGIIELANKGCDIIVDDVAYFDEPFFQDGIIAQAVDRVKKKGIAYFSAAGNSGGDSYESSYRATKIAPLGAAYGTAHDFVGTGTTATYLQPVRLPVNGTLISVLQWDQPAYSAGGAANTIDMDIYLLDSTGRRVLAVSDDDNIGSGDPVEVLGYTNTTRNTRFNILILKYDGPDPTRLKCVNFGDQYYISTVPAIPGSSASTIIGHPNAAGAIAVGAADYLQTPAYGVSSPVIEPYSSVGGAGIYFNLKGKSITEPLRGKPELTSVDGGNTSFFYPGDDRRGDVDTFPNFFGTSAAAPHAAAVAALMIEAQQLKTLTPDQIKGIMSANALDMDSPYFPGFDKGFDWATGAGLIKADAAVGAVAFPNIYIKDLSIKAACSDDPDYTRDWVVTNPNPFPVAVHWLINGFSQQGDLIAAPGVTSFTSQTMYLFNQPVANIAIIDWNDNLSIPHFNLAASTRAKCGKEAISAANTDNLSDQVVGADVIDKASTVAVYPNPTVKNFRVYLSLAGQQNADLSLYTLDGKLLLKKVVSSFGVVDIDASGYKTGMYILKVKQNNYSKTFKLVKQ